MTLYWVSMLVQGECDKLPWLCSSSEGCSSLEEALDVIERGKSNFVVLSAWVDTYDKEENKSTVFHECYVGPFGKVSYK